jgi:hypothetical protein
MNEYEIIAVLWQDHIQVTRSVLPKNPDKIVEKPTLSIGILMKETKKSILLVSDIERYEDRDEANYLIILKSSIVSMKGYGKVNLKKIRFD